MRTLTVKTERSSLHSFCSSGYANTNQNLYRELINDDRRYCYQCANLALTGLCLAAARGKIIAAKDYHPIGDLPLRCEGFQPKLGDLDQRKPHERWPKLYGDKISHNY